MSNTLHALDLLDQSELSCKPICVVFGDEPFLKQLVIKKLQHQILGDDSDVPFALFDGKIAEWRDVIDELSTVSLFGGDTRLALIDPADEFVSTYRSQLEDYVARPNATSTLVLIVDSWPSNTRLYKAIDKTGLQIECRAPEIKRGKNKQLDTKRLCKWLSSLAKAQHATTLPAASAEALLELVGPHLGLLDQALAKLALFTKPKEKITPQLVNDVVGGWRAQTIWELVGAAASGDSATALVELDRLLQSGEHPLALFGSI
ncbi:MAG: DNA polymerase III subunit delta, partial [Planctomycetes bacterium]|nr:DNA polymerase III subunit delta [Planctomycetota bacterium]